MNDSAQRLRALISDDKVRIVPELYDCASAKAAEMNGFDAALPVFLIFSCFQSMISHTSPTRSHQ